MINSELIKELKRYNKDAKVNIIVHNKAEDFTITFGYSDGVTPRTCAEISFYVDRLCKNDAED